MSRTCLRHPERNGLPLLSASNACHDGVGRKVQRQPLLSRVDDRVVAERSGSRTMCRRRSLARRETCWPCRRRYEGIHAREQIFETPLVGDLAPPIAHTTASRVTVVWLSAAISGFHQESAVRRRSLATRRLMRARVRRAEGVVTVRSPLGVRVRTPDRWPLPGMKAHVSKTRSPSGTACDAPPRAPTHHRRRPPACEAFPSRATGRSEYFGLACRRGGRVREMIVFARCPASATFRGWPHDRVSSAPRPSFIEREVFA